MKKDVHKRFLRVLKTDSFRTGLNGLRHHHSFYRINRRERKVRTIAYPRRPSFIVVNKRNSNGNKITYTYLE